MFIRIRKLREDLSDARFRCIDPYRYYEADVCHDMQSKDKVLELRNELCTKHIDEADDQDASYHEEGTLPGWEEVVHVVLQYHDLE